jgi:hypothetical protein
VRHKLESRHRETTEKARWKSALTISAKPDGVGVGAGSPIDSNGRTMWIVDAHRGDGNRFVVHADEKLTAFLELGSVIRAVVKQKLQSFSQNVWSDVVTELAKHKNGYHPHF